MTAERNPTSTGLNNSPGFSNQSKRRRLGLDQDENEIGFGDVNFPPPRPRPIDLLCADGITYEPLWSLWTLWKPRCPEDRTKVISTVQEYTEWIYNKVREFNPEFNPDSFDPEEDDNGDIHVVRIIGQPTVRGNQHTFSVKMKEFRGVRYTGNWTLQLFGDLAEVLTPGISDLKLEPELLIVGGSVDFPQKTIKLNWRLTSLKCQIIHYVNDGSKGPKDLRKPYDEFIETGNIQMVYSTLRSKFGRVLQMSSNFGKLLEEIGSAAKDDTVIAASVNNVASGSGSLNPTVTVPESSNSNNPVLRDSGQTMRLTSSSSGETFHSANASLGSPVQSLGTLDSGNMFGTPVGSMGDRDSAQSSPSSNKRSGTNGASVSPSSSSSSKYGTTRFAQTLEDSANRNQIIGTAARSFGTIDSSNTYRTAMASGSASSSSQSVAGSSVRTRSRTPEYVDPDLGLIFGSSFEEPDSESESSNSTVDLTRNSDSNRNRKAIKYPLRAPRDIFEYRTLKEYETELDEHGMDYNGHRLIRQQQHVYGVVQEVLPTTVPAAYECLICDETLDKVQVRIHICHQFTKLGPIISKGGILRIHRATVQYESTGRGRNKQMVISTSPHHNCVCFNYDPNITGDILKSTSAEKITFNATDVQRILELRKFITSCGLEVMGIDTDSNWSLVWTENEGTSL